MFRGLETDERLVSWQDDEPDEIAIKSFETTVLLSDNRYVLRQVRVVERTAIRFSAQSCSS